MSKMTHRRRKVAILVYEGVEAMDLAAPAEVFGFLKEHFEAWTVGLDLGPVRSQGFLALLPDHDLESCPPMDILVVPGGEVDALMGHAALRRWLADRSQGVEILFSICTGAGLLADAGLLRDMEVCTFHNYYQKLRALEPTCRVDVHSRFRLNGKVLTAAGVSAGIDASLFLVGRLLGTSVAQMVAAYMEYPLSNEWQHER